MSSQTAKYDTVKMYGIPNCDSIKKAKAWLTEQQIDFVFHDYRRDGLDSQWLSDVESKLGWEKMLNKRGTTYRQLSDEQKANLNKSTALALLNELPAMIKRPILVTDDQLTIGFKAAEYEALFA